MEMYRVKIVKEVISDREIMGVKKGKKSNY